MTPILETKRLILRPIELADAEQLQIVFPQWEIVRHLANKVPWPYPPDAAITYIREMALPLVETRAGVELDAAAEDGPAANYWRHRSSNRRDRKPRLLAGA